MPATDTPAFGHIIHGNGMDLSSAFTAYPIVDLLAEHSAVLLRSFRDGVASFEDFTDRLGRVRPANIRTGSVRRFESDNGTQAVNAGTMAVPLHAESYFTPICPQILAFVCVTNTASGGDTVLCDGRELFRTLPAHAREALAACDIVWRHECPVAELESQTQQTTNQFLRWCERAERCAVTLVEAAGRISIHYVAPAIRKTWWQGDPAFANNLIPISMGGLLADMAPGLSASVAETAVRRADELAVSHRWQPGDVMLVDNTRILHGRTPWFGGERHLRVRMLTVEDE